MKRLSEKKVMIISVTTLCILLLFLSMFSPRVSDAGQAKPLTKVVAGYGSTGSCGKITVRFSGQLDDSLSLASCTIDDSLNFLAKRRPDAKVNPAVGQNFCPDRDSAADAGNIGIDCRVVAFLQCQARAFHLNAEGDRPRRAV